ncbi:MAG: hypothetical protein H6619_02945 [Deltaproteobacteria bacterium]|nr:hypothetical protein [Deltaproteobacteria bacterium]
MASFKRFSVILLIQAISVASAYAAPFNLGDIYSTNAVSPDTCELSTSNSISLQIAASSNNFYRQCEGATQSQDAGVIGALVSVAVSGLNAPFLYGASCVEGYPLLNIVTVDALAGDARSIFASLATAFFGQFNNEQNPGCVTSPESCLDVRWHALRQTAEKALGVGLFADADHFSNCGAACDYSSLAQLFADLMQFIYFVETNQQSAFAEKIICKSSDMNRLLLNVAADLNSPDSVIKNKLDLKDCTPGSGESCLEVAAKVLFDPLNGACNGVTAQNYQTWFSTLGLQYYIANAVCI